MKNIRGKIAAFAAAALIFSGCGGIMENKENSSSKPQASAGTAVSSSSSEDSSDGAQSQNENALAQKSELEAASVKVKNTYSAESVSVSAGTAFAEKFYDTAEKLLAEGESADKPARESIASAALKFSGGSVAFIGIYPDGTVGIDVGGGEKYFTASESAQTLQDIYCACALNLIFSSSEFTVGEETQGGDSALYAAAEKYSDNFDEYEYIYLDSEEYFYINTECGDGIKYYCEFPSKDSEYGFTQASEYYEYITSATGDYYRANQYNGWYVEDSFKGTHSLESLPCRIQKVGEYKGSFAVDFGGEAYTAEHFSANMSDIYVLFDAGGEISGAWYDGENAVTMITKYRVSGADTDNLKEISEDAAAHADGESDENM